MFERETNREKNLEKAVKEAKVKARKEAAKTSDNEKDRAMDEQDILKVCLSLCVMRCDMYDGSLWPTATDSLKLLSMVLCLPKLSALHCSIFFCNDITMARPVHRQSLFICCSWRRSFTTA